MLQKSFEFGARRPMSYVGVHRMSYLGALIWRWYHFTIYFQNINFTDVGFPCYTNFYFCFVFGGEILATTGRHRDPREKEADSHCEVLQQPCDTLDRIRSIFPLQEQRILEKLCAS